MVSPDQTYPPSLVRRIFAPLVDYIYPPTCIACNRLLEDGTRAVCSTCWQSLTILTKGHPLYLETRQKLEASGVVTDLVSCFVFEKEGVFQSLAHALKYSGMESWGILLGRRLGEVMLSWHCNGDILLPIPLHRRKQRERGYNQAELIARGASEVTGIPVRANMLRRRKETKTQTQLTLEERRKNVEDAFELMYPAEREVRNATCILVDDVITTGATLISCAQEFKRAGAQRIIAASVALAQ